MSDAWFQLREWTDPTYTFRAIRASDGTAIGEVTMDDTSLINNRGIGFRNRVETTSEIVYSDNYRVE